MSDFKDKIKSITRTREEVEAFEAQEKKRAEAEAQAAALEERNKLIEDCWGAVSSKISYQASTGDFSLCGETHVIKGFCMWNYHANCYLRTVYASVEELGKYNYCVSDYFINRFWDFIVKKMQYLDKHHIAEQGCYQCCCDRCWTNWFKGLEETKWSMTFKLSSEGRIILENMQNKFNQNNVQISHVWIVRKKSKKEGIVISNEIVSSPELSITIKGSGEIEVIPAFQYEFRY